MDKRLKSYKKYKLVKEILISKECLCAVILGAIIGLSLGTYYWKSCQPKLLTPPVKPEAVKMVQEVEASETPCDFDPITYVRCSGEKLGKPNKDIMTMIRIAKAESNFRPRAKNPNSTASGIFQIIYGTWNGNDCEGNAFNFVDNINCAWKIQSRRGFQPWVSSSNVWNK